MRLKKCRERTGTRYLRSNMGKTAMYLISYARFGYAQSEVNQ
jgi:hypothetical protein